MENHSSQSSSSDRSGNSVTPFLQTQPFAFSETQQRSDWNFVELLNIVRRRALVIAGVTIAVMTTVVANLMLNRELPVYEGNFKLLVEPVNDDSNAVDVVKEPSSSTQSGLDYESQIQVLKSPELLEGIIKQLRADYPGLSYDSLLNSLTITRLGETKIIEVRYRNNNPDQVKAVLNKISKDYLYYSREKRQTKLRQGTQFVEKQLPFLQNRVDQLQKELQTFRQKNDFADPESQVAQVDTQATSVSGQRQTVNQQLAQVRSNFALLQQQNGKLAVLKDAPLYQQLVGQLRALDVQIAAESTRLQEDNPTLQTLKEKRQTLLPLIAQEAQRVLELRVAEVKNQLQTLEVQSQELAKVEKELEQKRKQWPILARQYTELQRKLQIATESLNRFLSTRETLQIQISQTELGWQLLQAPKKPETQVNSSDMTRNLLPGLTASIFLGLGVAFLMEKLDNTYHSVQALKDKVKLPLLGNIPFEKQIQSSNQNNAIAQEMPIVRVPNFLMQEIPGLAVLPDQDYSNYSTRFLEALRVLYTNIQLLSSDRQINSIVISSAMSGDGKSTVAFHLAQIATTMGQRVLLIDADLRQPMIHNLSDLNNLWGLSNLISTNLPTGEVIRQLPFMSQLSVVTAGPIPPDPAKLLSSEKMKRLMEDFHNTFDLVIYDAPPLIGLADASLLAPHTDGILLTVRLDQTDSSALDRALENLKMSRINILGMVSNGQKNNIRPY
ncbi:MAG: polysaccharide biosynthesis tyrosine autokinase [Desmonostoc vinosum HA7617-LM4]|jgi:capsular exopolysaccharide synthesis family protein|nr:polysaccharide biosynthesis tyrosine autokinase [Desmonostoc vinosum HA7617-LM4]